MLTELSQVADSSPLPMAARLAQVVIVATGLAYLVILRPANARADLLLELDFLQQELNDDLRAQRLPPADPLVDDLIRALFTARRSSRHALTREGWWPSGDGQHSSLNPAQQISIDEYRQRLTTALLRCQHGQLWWLWAPQPPRHFRDPAPASRQRSLPIQPQVSTLIDRARGLRPAPASASVRIDLSESALSELRPPL